jgi:hypothetical protein
MLSVLACLLNPELLPHTQMCCNMLSMLRLLRAVANVNHIVLLCGCYQEFCTEIETSEAPARK